MNYFKKRGMSFGYALNGIKSGLGEPNFRLQSIAAVLVVILGLLFGVNRYEWLSLISCIIIVLCLELINSAIENICNMVTAEIHPTVKYIKDVSAGAVLIASLGSLVVGAIVFYPYIKSFFS